MLKTAFLFLNTLLFTFHLSAQTESFTYSKINALRNTESQSFRLFQRVDSDTRSNQSFILDTHVMDALFTDSPQLISLDIPTMGKLLSVHALRSNTDTKAVTLLPSNTTASSIEKRTYQGFIDGYPNSLVSLSIFDDEVSGFITGIGELDFYLKKRNDGSYILAPVLNRNDDLREGCAMEDDGIMYDHSALRFNSSDNRGDSTCVEIYVEVDYDIFHYKGSLLKTQKFVQSIIDKSTMLYANEGVNVKFLPPHIWTEDSPYSARTARGMLTQFQYFRKSYEGDLGILLSYKASGGLAAGFSGLGNKKRSKSLSFASLKKSTYSRPNYSWNVDVVTHELGHLFGVRHTHACVWNGNGTAIDGCAGYTEGSCANPGITDEAGTIMSYCHVTSDGKDFTLGFGEQPGNVLRYNVKKHKDQLLSCSADQDSCLLNEIIVTLHTDRYGNETSWNIKNDLDSIIYEGSGYEGSTLYELPQCLPDGCYAFTIYDQFSDGMCCNYGDGYYTLTVQDSIYEGVKYTDSASIEFCVQKSITEEEIDNTEEDVSNDNQDNDIKPSPTDLLVSYIAENEISIQWKHESHTSGTAYIIYLNGTSIDTTTSLSKNISGLSPDTQYDIYIVAIENQTTSQPSNSISATTLKKSRSSSSLDSQLLYEHLEEEYSTSMPDSDIEINIYPNPTSDFININSDGSILQYEIYDNSGRSVMIDTSPSGTNRIELGELPKGVYFFRVRSELNQKTIKIIKI